MNWFDILIIIFLAGFLWYGFFFGLIIVLGNLFGLLIGAYGAIRFYLPIFNWLDSFLPLSPTWGKLFVFLIVFTLLHRLVSWLFVFLEKGFNLISVVPFLKTINRFLGAALGLAEGVFLLGVLAYLFDRHLPTTHFLSQWLTKSDLTPWLIKISKIIMPYIPKLINFLQTLF